MKCLILLLIFAQISLQLPWPGTLSQLLPRAHSVSPYTSNLKRQSHVGSKKLNKRQTEGSGTIVDNERLKYLLPITFGTQTLDAELDSGSSDTWLIKTGFQCYNTFDSSAGMFNTPESAATCNFGGTYTPDASFALDSELYQLSCYGGSAETTLRCVAGDVGVSPLTICGLNIPQQLVGTPNLSSYPAQGIAEQSGIIGLAFPALSGFLNKSTNAVVPYPTIMDTLFEIDTYDPPLAKQFSLAISRDASGSGNGGIFTIGGIPSLTDPAVNVSSTTYTSAAFQYYANFSTTDYSFYSFYIDNFAIGTSTAESGLQVVIDSGANALQIPTDAANLINSVWSPAINNDGSLACNAVLTQPVGITIGGATYYLSSPDLIATASDGTCYSLVFPVDAGPYLVGDPLLRNVLAVYDWGNLVMSFYPRMQYAS